MKDISITKLSTISVLSGGERIPLSQVNIAHNNQLETLYTTPSAINTFVLSYDIFEVGAVWPYAAPVSIGNPVPTGWLLCDGAEITVADHRKLHSVIGNTYGTSAPGVSFRLPNMQGRFLMGYCTTAPAYTPADSAGLSISTGSTGGVYNTALNVNQMPLHAHAITADATLTIGNAGALFLHYPETLPNNGRIEQQQKGGPGDYSTSVGVTLNISVTPTIQSVGGNQMHNNTPPYICMNYIIKT